MSKFRIHFTYKSILRKHFHIKMRGYDPTDVDSFLDMIITDYRNFNGIIRTLRDEIHHANISKNDIYVNMQHKLDILHSKYRDVKQQNQHLRTQITQAQMSHQFHNKEKQASTNNQNNNTANRIKEHLQQNGGHPTKKDLHIISNRLQKLEKAIY